MAKSTAAAGNQINISIEFRVVSKTPEHTQEGNQLVERKVTFKTEYPVPAALLQPPQSQMAACLQQIVNNFTVEMKYTQKWYCNFCGEC